MMIYFNGFNVVNFAVLLAPIAAKTALSLGSGDGGALLERGPPPPTASAYGEGPSPSSGNTAAPTTGPSLSSKDGDGDDDGHTSYNALMIGLGMTFLVVAIVGYATFSLYRRFQNGGDGAGWGRWALRRHPVRSQSTYNGMEIPIAARRIIRSPFHPNGNANLPSLSLPQRRVGGGGGVVVGIPIPPSPRSDDDVIPSISVSLPPQGWGYDNEYLSSPTLLTPPTSPPPFELGGTYILPVDMPTPASSDNNSDNNNNSNCAFDVDGVEMQDIEDEHEPCEPQSQYSSISTSASPLRRGRPQLEQNYYNAKEVVDVQGDGTPPAN